MQFLRGDKVRLIMTTKQIARVHLKPFHFNDFDEFREVEQDKYTCAAYFLNQADVLNYPPDTNYLEYLGLNRAPQHWYVGSECIFPYESTPKINAQNRYIWACRAKKTA